MNCGRYKEKYGNHEPICGGLCLIANTGWKNLTPISVFMITLPAMCWFYFLSSEINERVAPAFSYLIGIFCGFALLFLFITMLTEPGILPTITIEEYTEDNPDVPMRVLSKVILDGREYDLKRFRAKFSRYTANCIENFDHYCPWVGNAIGKRNYRYFFFFMSNCLILSLLVAISCSWLLIKKSMQDHKDFFKTMEESVAATIIAIYSYCLFFSLLGLCGFHIKAISSNTTTNETLKGVFHSHNRNPYDHGCSRNCSSFFCSPVTPSRILDFNKDMYHSYDNLTTSIGDSFFPNNEIQTNELLNADSLDREVVTSNSAIRNV